MARKSMAAGSTRKPGVLARAWRALIRAIFEHRFFLLVTASVAVHIAILAPWIMNDRIRANVTPDPGGSVTVHLLTIPTQKTEPTPPEKSPDPDPLAELLNVEPDTTPTAESALLPLPTFANSPAPSHIPELPAVPIIAGRFSPVADLTAPTVAKLSKLPDSVFEEIVVAAKAPPDAPRPMPKEIPKEDPPKAKPAPQVKANNPAAAPSPPEKKPGVRSTAKRLGYAAPVYPPEALAFGQEGRPLIRVVIGVDGRVVDVSVYESSGHQILDRAAVEFVRQLMFVPEMLDGQPVRSEHILPINYSIEK